jgi:hypothetical protein
MDENAFSRVFTHFHSVSHILTAFSHISRFFTPFSRNFHTFHRCSRRCPWGGGGCRGCVGGPVSGGPFSPPLLWVPPPSLFRGSCRLTNPRRTLARLHSLKGSTLARTRFGVAASRGKKIKYHRGCLYSVRCPFLSGRKLSLPDYPAYADVGANGKT